MKKIRKIQWIIIIVDNYKEMKKFYIDKLGFNVVREVLEDVFLQMQLGTQTFALYGKKEISKLLGKEYVTKDYKSTKTIFSLNESTDIVQDYNDFQQKGVNFIQSPKLQSWGQYTAYFKDPEGNIWELQKWERK